MPPMIPALELTQLGKSYDVPQGPSVIVKDFNLKVSPGEFVCIIGHSGCGKSTVLSIVMGLNNPTEGGVILAGKEVSGAGLDRGVVSIFRFASLADRARERFAGARSSEQRPQPEKTS